MRMYNVIPELKQEQLYSPMTPNQIAEDVEIQITPTETATAQQCTEREREFSPIPAYARSSHPCTSSTLQASLKARHEITLAIDTLNKQRQLTPKSKSHEHGMMCESGWQWNELTGSCHIQAVHEYLQLINRRRYPALHFLQISKSQLKKVEEQYSVIS